MEMKEFTYVLACVDPKIKDALIRMFNERFGSENYFMPTELGGVKNLTTPEKESDREYVLRKMKSAWRVHHFDRIILINHSDCAAWRLAGTTFENAESEENFHRAELEKATTIIKEVFPDATIETHYFLKPEGKLAW